METLFCGTYPATGMLHQCDCSALALGRGSLSVSAGVDDLSFTSQKGKKLTLLMFTRLLLLRKDFQSAELIYQALRFLRDGWWVSQRRDCQVGSLERIQCSINAVSFLIIDRTIKLTERQRRAADSRMT